MDEAKLERLILINEECAEVQQAISKIIRYGECSYNPLDINKVTNKNELVKELSHLVVSMLLFAQEEQKLNPLLASEMEQYSNEKIRNINQWLRYNKIEE
jgi:hypothetical protein